MEPFEALGWGDDDDLGNLWVTGEGADAVPEDGFATPEGGEFIKAHAPRGPRGNNNGGVAHLGEVLHDLLGEGFPVDSALGLSLDDTHDFSHISARAGSGFGDGGSYDCGDFLSTHGGGEVFF